MLAAVGTAHGLAAGPPAGHTGAPGETTCRACHSGSAFGSGAIRIAGIPVRFESSQQVRLTVRVSDAAARRWGFQITALDAANRPAGTFVLLNRNVTRIVNGRGALEGRTYVEHTANGTFAGQGGEASWLVSWTAPAADPGLITFYASGNAADGDGSSNGDTIYNVASSIGGDMPFVLAPVYKKGRISVQAEGSEIVEGATLELSGNHLSQTEVFPLRASASHLRWVVARTARSTPGGLTVRKALPRNATVTLVVRNPSGLASEPVVLTRS